MSKEPRLTVRLTKADLEAVSALREHLRKADPWTGRSATLRFAIGYTFDALRRSQGAQ
jgi:hypothetical protein